MSTETIISSIEENVKSNNGVRVELSGFAEACYNDCTEQDLASCLRDFHHDAPEQSCDTADCEQWGISPTQWYNQIELALTTLVSDRLENES